MAIKTKDGEIKGKLAFYDYIRRKDLPWKYQYIADEMYEILDEGIYNDTYL